MANEASVSGVLDGDSNQTSDLPSGSVSTDSEPMVPSLLDCLRAPQKSELSLKCTLQKNPSAAESLCKKRPPVLQPPKSITLHSRVRGFLSENLKVSAGKLLACREEFLKRSIITNHIASVKHKQSKVRRRAGRKILLRLW